jgi:hypothetical protein
MGIAGRVPGSLTGRGCGSNSTHEYSTGTLEPTFQCMWKSNLSQTLHLSLPVAIAATGPRSHDSSLSLSLTLTKSLDSTPLHFFSSRIGSHHRRSSIQAVPSHSSRWEGSRFLEQLSCTRTLPWLAFHIQGGENARRRHVCRRWWAEHVGSKERRGALPLQFLRSALELTHPLLVQWPSIS